MDELTKDDLTGIDWLSERRDQTLEQVIAESFERLRNYLDENFTDPPAFDAWLSGWENEIDSGRITNEQLNWEWGAFLLAEGKKFDEVPFNHSAIFTCLARNLLVQGQREKAWAFINHASFCAGIAQAAGWRVYDEMMDRSEVAALGGKGRWADHALIKDELVRLLASPPTGGWGKRKSTAEELERKIKAFMQDQKLTLDSAETPPSGDAKKCDQESDQKSKQKPKQTIDLFAAIYRWLGDGEIRKAYLAHRA